MYNHNTINLSYNASSQSAQKTYTNLLIIGKKYRVSFDFGIDGITTASFTLSNGSTQVRNKTTTITTKEITEFTATATNLTILATLSAGNYGRLAHIDNLVIEEIFEVGEGYRFGFNGMEKDDDTYGEGNAYDFGNRIFDSRLGRWLSVDRFAGKYPSLSPYVFAENNPIVILDIGGDSTIYFSESGKKIGVTWDNLENAIVVIKSSDVAKFTAQLWLAKISFTQDVDKTNEKLRTMGKAYSITSIENWYKAVKNIKPVDSWGGAIGILVNGKLLKFLSEAAINLVVGKDGLIRVGNKKNQTTGDPTTTAIPNTSGEDGIVDGFLHDHPNPRGDQNVIMENGEKGNYFGTHSQSDADDNSSTNRPGNSGVINDNSIIIFRKATNPGVKFDRKERFKR